MESLLVTFLNFEIAAWMVRRLPQLRSTQINWFDLPSRIMLQWFGVSANAALNTRWTQFTIHANYKRIDWNVMDCGNVIKVPTPLSAKSYFPPDKHALYRDDSSSGHCQFTAATSGAVSSEDNFGWYGDGISTKFRCTQGGQSTTQWWFGAHLWSSRRRKACIADYSLLR